MKKGALDDYPLYFEADKKLSKIRMVVHRPRLSIRDRLLSLATWFRRIGNVAEGLPFIRLRYDLKRKYDVIWEEQRLLWEEVNKLKEADNASIKRRRGGVKTKTKN